MFETPVSEDVSESYMEGSFYAESTRSHKTAMSTPSATMDYRILWIREKIMRFLCIEDYYGLFNDLMNANDRYNEEKLLMMLNEDTYENTDLDFKQIFFYKTYREEVVQQEIMIWEEGRAKIAAMGSFAAQVKAQRLVKSAPDDKRKRGKSSKKGKKGKILEKKQPGGKQDKGKSEQPVSGDHDEATSVTAMRKAAGLEDSGTPRTGDEEEEDEEEEAEDEESIDEVYAMLMKEKSQPTLQPTVYEEEFFVPPPGQEKYYVRVKKLVERLVQVPILHCFFGEIDGSNTALDDQRLIYVLRSSEAAIPGFDTRSQCWREMPHHVMVGSLEGRFLDSMAKMLKDVFKPLVEKQFRGPEAAQDQATQEALKSMMNTPGIEMAATFLCDLSRSQGPAFMPPSQVRRVSLLAEKMECTSRCSQDMIPDKPGIKPIDKSKETEQIFVEPSKVEFLDYLSDLLDSVEWTLDHVEGDTLLTIPDILEHIGPELTDADLAKSKKLIDELEDIVLSWEKHITKVLESYRSKTPYDRGPLAEYAYWHDRESGLSMLVEQLRSTPIERILNILNLSHSAIGSGFIYFSRELNVCYAEAKENNKFLSTILRYLKMVTESDSFNAIAHEIPLLYEHLRIIWVLSKYYSTEERMASLLERISWQLRQNVMKNLAIKQLFDEPLEIALSKTEAAHKMLKLWKLSYLQTRNDIELSGKGARWEFEQRRLFKDTDYLSAVSANLNEVAGVLRDFYNIFGEELKAIVNDPARIDAIVERVGQLLVPIRGSESEAFNEFNRESWEATMSWFRGEVERLELEAKVFIDECFGALIRAEDALATLMKFKRMKTRAAVHERLSMKFDVIMQQFGKEIDEVEAIFNRGKRKPPLLRYHPPIAGAIYWERQLFHRLKGPILIFREVEELRDSELRAFVFEQYVALSKQLKAYEETKFQEFTKKAHRVLQNSMQRNVLTLQPADRKTIDPLSTHSKTLKINAKRKASGDHSSILTTPAMSHGEERISFLMTSKPGFDTRMSSNISLKTSATSRSYHRSEGKGIMRVSKSRPSSSSTITEKLQLQILKNTELMRGAILLENQIKLTVNFNEEAFTFIREAELLEHLGFELPTSIREIGIQKDRLHADCEEVERMINQYNDIIEKFDDADILLLKRTLENVEKQIQPGVTRLNWFSLSIADYAANCSKLLKSLASMVSQVNQIRRDLDAKIDDVLGSYNLFATKDDPDEPGYELRTCKAYFLEIENKRTELVSTMLKCYESTSPMLIKLESLVEGTSTGKSPAMLLYYERYEQKIFTAFITCFLRNLEHLKKMLTLNKPMFQVNAALLASEVVLKPSSNEIYTIIMGDVKDLLQRLRVFPRWMVRTCLECKPVKDDTGSDFVTFSYFEDVMNVQVINDLIFSVQDMAHRLSYDCWRYLYKWKQYSNLWSLDKTQVGEKLAATHPTLQQYDEKLGFYDSIIEELDEMKDYYDVSSIRINLQPLLNGIKEHAREWKHVLGNLLLTDTLHAMSELKATIDKFKGEVEVIINGLERFKVVMQCISDVKRMAIHAEVKYMQYQETFRILRAHKVDFSTNDEEMAYKLQHDWQALYLGALYRADNLESTKDQFCDMTKREIEDFSHEISEFVERFLNEGPASCSDNLDLGATLMDEYEPELFRLDERMVDLKNAELLFDLPPTDYSGFLTVKRDFEAMTELFKMYKAQKNARDGWAKTLWADLNPQKLVDGMDGFLRDFRKMPKAMRTLTVGRAIEEAMKCFKNSVPLFVELKNEAMRERHWQELMDQTGKHFDMAPDRCDQKD